MAEIIAMISLDAQNREFMPDEVFETESQARETIEYLSSRYDTETGPFVYAVMLNDELIGHVEAVQISLGWEVGYHIAEAHTGHGYATEALSAFLLFIQNKLKTDILYGICRADNFASRRVLEKCGFKLDFDGEALYHGKMCLIRRYISRLS